MSLKSKLASRRFPTRDVTICLDGELVRRHEEAQAALNNALQAAKNDTRLGAAPGKDERAALESIEADMRSTSITIRITGVPFGQYNQFMHANGPRKGKQEAFNAETFFMYVARRTGKYIDENGTEQEIEPSDWDAFEEALTDSEHDKIAAAIIAVNRVDGGKGVDFLSTSSVGMRGFSGSSAQPVPGE